VYSVPGMGHCQGGPATDQFDALGALVNWVEKGQAPDRIDAKVNPSNRELPAGWSAQRGRPLCPHPQVMRYTGGDVESAASFRCATP
jgi:feruloyl esterase